MGEGDDVFSDRKYAIENRAIRNEIRARANLRSR